MSITKVAEIDFKEYNTQNPLHETTPARVSQRNHGLFLFVDKNDQNMSVQACHHQSHFMVLCAEGYTWCVVIYSEKSEESGTEKVLIFHS